MSQQLKTHRYVAGSSYSLADITISPWLRSWQNQGIDWADYPELKAWFDKIGQRSAVKRGVEVMADLRKPLTGDKERENFLARASISAVEESSPRRLRQA